MPGGNAFVCHTPLSVIEDDRQVSLIVIDDDF
jgi:hypothetical protein